MTNRFRNWTVAALAAATCVGVSAAADDKQPGQPSGVEKLKDSAAKAAQEAAPGGMDPEMMQKWMAASMPGPHHKHLEQFVGRWNHTIEWRMTPEMPAEKSEGKSEMKFIMDGRYLLQDSSGPGIDPNGPPMRGMGITGHNNISKRYEGIWIDNGSTAMMMFTGTCSDDGKTFTNTGEYADPMADGKLKKIRTVGRIIDKDTHTFELFEPGPDGVEFRSMLITYKRAP